MNGVGKVARRKRFVLQIVYLAPQPATARPSLRWLFGAGCGATLLPEPTAAQAIDQRIQARQYRPGILADIE